MATASVTNPSLPDTPPDKTKVNTNFTDLVNFINTNVIQSDGSLAFTAIPQVAGGLVAASDGSATSKYETDLTLRQMPQYVHCHVDWDTYALAGDALGDIELYGDSCTLAIPSWAQSMTITVNTQVAGTGGLAAGGSAYAFWFCLEDEPTIIFGGHINDETWGTSDTQRHNIILRTTYTIPSDQRGQTWNVNLAVQALAYSHKLFSGSEAYTDWSILFWDA